MEKINLIRDALDAFPDKQEEMSAKSNAMDKLDSLERFVQEAF
ncbi:hypothetical protein SDC9_62064 [bioreactor metagenome]|uniref:Uncharacterized protein n=1 Tax=bioreactor metagenome TaxID=1076179 RepID=A0A644XN57_9ZZZZ